ncbi:TetR/AcrR family transcriptional regulator [Rhodococcus qingshengii]|uniref:TetR/AcrR family transcriptional regulator n=1 Tax=Rhodococcus qingshengii TaxID=334542 RepID=UPI003017FAFA
MTSTRDQLKQATHLRVLDTASRLFQERGFAATTVRDIAEGTGVSSGTVMSVGDKNGLLVRVFDMMITTVHAQRAGSELQPTSDVTNTCVHRLGVLVQSFVSLFTDNPELARSYASILVSGTHSSSLFTHLAARLTEEFVTAITLRGCTSQPDAPAVAQALYAAYVGTLFTWSALGSDDPSGLTNSLRTTFAAICTCKE